MKKIPTAARTLPIKKLERTTLCWRWFRPKETDIRLWSCET